jgi:hypothetical protein
MVLQVVANGQPIARLGNMTREAATKLVESWRGWTVPDEYGDVGYPADAHVELVEVVATDA